MRQNQKQPLSIPPYQGGEDQGGSRGDRPVAPTMARIVLSSGASCRLSPSPDKGRAGVGLKKTILGQGQPAFVRTIWDVIVLQ